MEKGDRMGIKNVVEVVKQVHKEEIVFVKIGKFYQVYGKDAYIISYFFDYKLKKVEEVYMCGFPESSINRVTAKLEDLNNNNLCNVNSNGNTNNNSNSNGFRPRSFYKLWLYN